MKLNLLSLEHTYPNRTNNPPQPPPFGSKVIAKVKFILDGQTDEQKNRMISIYPQSSFAGYK